MQPLSQIPPVTATAVGPVDTIQLLADQLTAVASVGARSLTVRIFSGGVVQVHLSNGPDLFEAVVRPLLPTQLVAQPLTLTVDSGRWRLSAGTTAVWITPDLGVEVMHQSQPTFCLEDWTAAHDAVFCSVRQLPDEHLYGLGEKTGDLDKQGRAYTQWTTDVHPHTPSTDAMYVALPMAILASPRGARGLFLANTFRTYFDSRDRGRLRFGADNGPLSLYLFLGPTLSAVLEQYTALTGRMPLPPRWALGFQQSRYSYLSQARVLDVAHEFRARQIPIDVMYLDIDYMDDYRIFTWNPVTFAQPEQLLRKLGELGIHVVTIIDPGVKEESSYAVYESGQARDAFIRYANSEPFRSHVWPGQCVFPDFVRHTVREWWGQWNRQLIVQGVSGIWNDMNEPAFFGADPRNPARTGYATDAGITHLTDGGEQLSHDGIHNVYALLQAAATYEGIRSANQPTSPRPFILSRSGYAGIQNFAAVWTGDNSSWWEHLAMAIPMCLNLGLSGVPFVGPDIGGFFDSPSPELFARWIQAGVFFPFVRVHTNKGTNDQEPWSFGPEVEAIARRYIEYRYRLLPYLETLFEEAMRTGAPIMRPLFWEFGSDATAYTVQDQFLLGPALLVAPVVTPATRQRLVYLPEGAWYYPWTHQLELGPTTVVAPAPLDQVPVFLRGGSVLPLGPVVQSTRELAERWSAGQDGPDLFWVVKGHGRFSVYSDDGLSRSYAAGQYRRVTVTVDTADDETTLTVTGQWAAGVVSLAKRYQWRVVHYAKAPRSVEVDGQPIPWTWNPATGAVAFELPRAILAGETVPIRIVEG